MPREALNTYWLTHRVAMRVAARWACTTGVRHRVQRVTWTEGVPRLGALSTPARWHVSPTPAPAPGYVGEPCS